ncbi:MAG: hypothetical protein HKN13_14755, partial [Rhodothermales bacterium]|nr:hypothetical protein [Rhodothermales bacterium]
LGHLRNLYVARTMGDARLIEATADVQNEYSKAAKTFSEPDLLRMMTVVADTEESIRYSAKPRLTVELGALKLVQMASVEDLHSLIELARTAAPRRDSVSPATESTSRKAPASSPSGTKAAEPLKAHAKPVPAQHSPKKREVLAEDTESRTDADAASAEASAGTDTPDATADSAKTPTRQTQKTKEPRVDRATPPEPVSTERSAPEIPEDSPGLFGTPALKKQPRPSNSVKISRTEGSAALAAAPSVESDKSPELREIESIWLAFVRAVKSDRIHVGALLQHASPADLATGKLIVSVPDDFHRRLLTNQEEFLRDQLRAHTTIQVTELHFSIRSEQAFQEEEDSVEEFDAQEYLKKKRKESPMVQALFDEFGGELVW